ncbi:hypothetical protein EXIGLDRAFT_735584 [Exidia glandulosa HHB12029]|uniref:F-box domain-containing protein n=1 Tax=Exidia glandulosa HHB12029 TaxID=1314781 RepID=A0A165JSY1_EXIGL|nr:hypothetical protein EXIGLDRAFT_735584 [Exidia glandulosa HHB12029]
MAASLTRFGELPAELGIAIVQLAACADTRDALTLVLVSSNFRAIVRPVLYRTVRITPRNLLLFEDPTRRKHVTAFTRNIIVHTSLGPQLPVHIAMLCCGQRVQSICCTPPVFQSLSTSPSMPSSRPRVHIVRGIFPLSEVTAHTTGATHLYIESCLLPLTPPITPCNFENAGALTHIILRPWIPRPNALDLIREFAASLSALLDACPNLQRIAVRVHDPARDESENSLILRTELALIGGENGRLYVDAVTLKNCDGVLETLTCDDAVWRK